MDKKGITPIIAVILLLMMTVAAAGAAFFWLTRIQGELQGGAEQYEETVFERIASDVGWQDANYNSSTEILTIYLQNLGTTDISLDNGTTDPTTTWLLKDNELTTICSAKWSSLDCISGCGTTLDQAAIGAVSLNLSDSPCDIDSYASDTRMTATIFFSGKASASGQFDT